MPLTQTVYALGSAGLVSVACGAVAYARSATTPFKLAYAAAWPLLGSAVILGLQPSKSEVTRSLTPEEQQRLSSVHAANVASFAALKASSQEK